MFIDYITLMLANMVGGLVILVFYVVFAANREDNKAWAPAFAMPGFVGIITGMHMSLTWPVPDLSNIREGAPNLQFANCAFGEMTVLLAVLFLAAAWSLKKKWSLKPLTIYAFIAGAMAIIVGLRLWNLGLTRQPPLTGVGFILTGTCGVLSGSFLWLRKLLLARIVAVVILLAAAAVWLLVAVGGYWGHMQTFSTAG